MKFWSKKMKMLSILLAFAITTSSVTTTVCLLTNSTAQEEIEESSGETSSTTSSGDVNANSTSSSTGILQDDYGYYIEMGEYPTTFAGYVSSTSYTSTTETFTLASGTSLIVYTDGTDRYVQVTASPQESGYYYSDTSSSVTAVATWFKIEPIQWQIVGVYNDDGVTGSSTSSVTAYTGQTLESGQSLVVKSRLGLDSSNFDSSGDTSIDYVDSAVYTWLKNFYSYILSDYADCIVSRSVDYNTTASHTTYGDYYDNYSTEQVWLMSYTEQTRWLTTTEEHYTSPSDLALASYTYMATSKNWTTAYRPSGGTINYWLRSTFTNSSNATACIVHADGNVTGYYYEYWYANVCYCPCMLVSVLPNDLGIYSDLTDEDGNAVEYWISNAFSISQSWSGSGTETDPYLIQSAGDLALLSYNVFTGASTYSGVYFEQTADLDLSAYYWMPIGGHCTSGSSTSNLFAGNYDGGGYEISGLKTYYGSNSSAYNYAGLFGYAYGNSSCTIHDLAIVESTIVGLGYTAAVAGRTDYARIYNCSNEGCVTGYGSYIGGIVGYAISTEIYNCYNSENISGVGYVGGIVGYNMGGSSYNSIFDCYNTGVVKGSSTHVGGVIGMAYGFLYVYSCYNIGSVEGSYIVGGIVGRLGASTSYIGYLYNCFRIGDVTATDTGSRCVWIGGLVGYFNSGSAVANCYYGDCTITDGNGTTYQKGIGYDNSTGEEGEDSSGVVEHLANISAFAKLKSWFADESLWNSSYAWDFEETWSISAKENDGYPILQKWTVTMGLAFDEDGEYWFYEDGMFPQSAVTDADLISSLESGAALTGESYAVGSEVFAVWTFCGDEYVKVTTSGKSGTASDSGCTWFLVEPIRWIVAYGTADEEPTSVSGAVSALVITVGSYKANSSTDLAWTSLYATTRENSNVSVASGDLQFSVTDSIVYDAFNTTASQTVVFSVNLDNITSTSGNTTVTSAGYRVASVNEIDSLGRAYATECSDFVAFLLSGGASADGETYGTAAYWTRDLAYSLDADSYYGTAHGSKAYSYDGTYNQGVYVTSDGIISNATLKNIFGARLSVSV